MCNYKHALLLHKLFNLEVPKKDYIDLYFQQVINGRTGTLSFVRTNNYKIGLNLICNRMHIINNRIEDIWMSESLHTYKIRRKKIFFKILMWVGQCGIVLIEPEVSQISNNC